MNFIKEKNNESKSSLKEFYVIIKYCIQDSKVIENYQNIYNETIIQNTLNEYFFKIKETLSRCGNIVYDLNSKLEVEKVIKSFFDSKY